MLNRIVFALSILAASPAYAEGDRCWLISNVAATSIAAGAITTSELAMTPGGLRPSATTAIPTFVKIGVDLVDASDGVSSILLTFTGAEATGGTFRTVPDCSGGTCVEMYRDWNPQTGGKAWYVESVPWRYPYGKITLTPVGHGAGDTAALAVYGCTGGVAGDAGSLSGLQTRACAYATGGATEVDCSAGAAYSGQLAANARYSVQAVDGFVRFAQTSAGSGQDPDANDMFIPSGSWLDMSTINGSRYIACLGTEDTATMRYMRCQ